ncbi:hypothetical protein B0H17DRAFT_931433, partial [Mycena rosella]
APALEAVEHEVQVYHVGFSSDLSPFQIPPSPTLDQMWSDLYNGGISRITKEEAARLPNKTHTIPGDDEHYIVELDVFHNLHCLVCCTTLIYCLYLPCREILNLIFSSQDKGRQSLMCAGDISVIVLQWDPAQNIMIFQGDVVHTCRNFDKLREWATRSAHATTRVFRLRTTL